MGAQARQLQRSLARPPDWLAKTVWPSPLHCTSICHRLGSMFTQSGPTECEMVVSCHSLGPTEAGQLERVPLRLNSPGGAHGRAGVFIPSCNTNPQASHWPGSYFALRRQIITDIIIIRPAGWLAGQPKIPPSDEPLERFATRTAPSTGDGHVGRTGRVESIKAPVETCPL